MNDGLPQKWVELELRECIEVLDNQRVPVNSDERAKRQGGVPYYGATGQVGWIDDFLFDEELVLIGEDGAPFFDKSKPIAYIIRGKSWVNNHAHVLRARSGITSNQYLKHFLDWFDFHDYVNGTTRLKLTQGAMNRIPVCVAPLSEQRRIVAKLERLLGHVDSCKQRLAKIPALLKRFRQAVLAAACSGRLTADWREENVNIEAAVRLGDGEPPCEFDLPSTWNWMLSLHAFGFVTSGSRGWARYYSDQGALFIRIGNLNHDAIKLDVSSIQRVSPPAGAEGRRTKVIDGDILISITADVGMIALVQGELEEAYINQHVALVRPVGNMDRRYLAYFLAAKNGGQEQLLNLQRGATKVGLGLDDIRSIWIARPPFLEQQEIVRRVESLLALADQIEARHLKAKAHIEKISSAILSKAFKGELVRQDRNDKPASVLLDRIREQADEEKPSRRKANRAACAAV